MEQDAEKRVRGNEIDRLTNLPESLLCRVLMKLGTKDVVKTSVLSSRWKHIWRFVPGLDLGYNDFPDYATFVAFIISFLDFDTQSYLQKFKLKSDFGSKLKYEWESYEPDLDLITRWIDIVVKRKVQHLHVLESLFEDGKEVEIPLSVYNCASLVSLKLCDVILPNPESVFLPSVEFIHLDLVKFANDLAFETLISGCPILERLIVERSSCDNVKALRVRSESLLSFTHYGHYEVDVDEDLVVVVDAPRLEKLELFDHETDRFVVNNLVSLVKVDIDVKFNFSSRKRFDPNDLRKRSMIRNFLIGISQVKNMVISSDTLEVFYKFSRCEQLPLLRNLSSLRAKFDNYRWEMLPIFLESCPNLKSLNLELSNYPVKKKRVSISPGPIRFLTSLEYVKIVKYVEDATEMKLASYFLENSTVLKEFTFCLGEFRKNEESVILKKLLAIPKVSSSCQVSVL